MHSLRPAARISPHEAYESSQRKERRRCVKRPTAVLATSLRNGLSITCIQPHLAYGIATPFAFLTVKPIVYPAPLL